MDCTLLRNRDTEPVQCALEWAFLDVTVTARLLWIRANMACAKQLSSADCFVPIGLDSSRSEASVMSMSADAIVNCAAGVWASDTEHLAA